MKKLLFKKRLVLLAFSAIVINLSASRIDDEKSTTITNIEKYIQEVAPVQYSKDKTEVAKMIYLNTKIAFGNHREQIAYLLASIIHYQSGFRQNLLSGDMELLGDIQISEKRLDEVIGKSSRLTFLAKKSPMEKRAFLKSHAGSIMVAIEILYLNKEKIKWGEANHYLRFYDLLSEFKGDGKDNQEFVIGVMENYKTFYRGI